MPLQEIHEYFMETLGQEFKWGRESLEDDGLSARPKDAAADENVKVVHTLVMCDWRRDLRIVASEMSICFGAVQSILTDILGMSKVSARWLPRMLTDDQTSISFSKKLVVV